MNVKKLYRRLSNNKIKKKILTENREGFKKFDEAFEETKKKMKNKKESA